MGPPLRRVLGERAPLRLWICLTCSPQGPAVESGGQGWGDPSRQKQEVLGGVPAGKDEATSQRRAGAQGPSKAFQLPGKPGSTVQESARARWVAWETEELTSPGKPEEAILSPIPPGQGLSDQGFPQCVCCLSRYGRAGVCVCVFSAFSGQPDCLTQDQIPPRGAPLAQPLSVKSRC